MANDNTVTVIGNATRDPELRFTNSGQAVANFGIAYNKRKKNSSTGEWEDQDPAFFNVTVWGQMAENVAESIQKGTRCVVFGRLDQRSWETKEGDKRSQVEIIADEVCASMRWATVAVTRNEKRGSGDGGNRGGGGDRGGNQGGNSGGGDRGYNPDEEPF
jgi:single-strand DNA-binding protein